MEELKGILELTKIYGLPVVIVFYLLWERRQEHLEEIKEHEEIENKKQNGEWISWQSIPELKNRINSMQRILDLNRTDIQSLKANVDRLENTLRPHLEKEALEDIMFAEMRKDQNFIRERINGLKEMFEKLEEHQQKAFDLIGDIKTRLIQ